MMAGQVNWQRQLTFSDRLSVTSKITEAYKEANPECFASEATKHAKLEESAARKDATSLPEYHELCARSIGRLLASKLSQSQDEHQSEDDHPSTDLPEHGTQIGRYTNASHYKDGISSDIYKAKDLDSNQTVALKVTTPSMMTAPHDSIREARILVAAQSPNIITLLDTFTHHERFVLVFPFMPLDLRTLLQQRNQIPETSKRPLLADLFTGLATLHSLGIVHRDIKPSNILLHSPRGPAYIADLGTAWSSSDAASEPPATKHLEVGTTSYRPPELLFGKQDYGSKLDMWAAGCVAAQVLGLGNRTMFDSGDLGSELALIKSIFETLGTPDLDIWPEAATLPDWGKMRFTQYARKPWEEVLPGFQPQERDLVGGLLVYESGNRLSAQEVLQHGYFEAR